MSTRRPRNRNYGETYAIQAATVWVPSFLLMLKFWTYSNKLIYIYLTLGVNNTVHDTDLSVAEQGWEGWMMPEITVRVPGGCGAGLRPLMPPSSVLQHTRRQDLSLGQDSCYSRLCGPTSQQHPNTGMMLYVVCDLVICCVHQQCSGQGLFQWCCCSLGQSSETTAAMGLYHHKKIIWSLDTDLQLCGRNEPNFILLWRLKCWEHAFWGIKHIHNSCDRSVTSV